MATPPLSDEVVRQTVELMETHRSQIKAAAAAGVSRSTFQSRLRVAALRGMMGTAPVLEGFEIKQVSTQRGPDGETQREWVQQRSERGGVFQIPDGHQVKGVSALTDGEGRVLQQWVKTKEGPSSTDWLAGLREALSDCRGAIVPPVAPAAADDDLLTVYALPDLHIGMMAWGRETGENWDLDKSLRTLRAAVSDLVARAWPARHAVVLGLGDYFHLNDRTNSTPSSKHILDVDGRWPKVLRAGARLAFDMTQVVASRHDQVEVRMLPGNHDEDAAHALTTALGLAYDGHERIRVNEEPGHHWFRRFGKVLLGASHGHTVKPEAMAMMMAADRAEDWGQSLFRYAFMGHIHHMTAKEVGPVRVETLQTPVPRDAYAASHGYRAGRSLTSITFHRERGEIGRNRVELPLA